MKYKSLRFFIQINSLVGYGVILGGILLSLIWAIGLGSSVGGAGGFFFFILTLLIGGLVSVVLGLMIFAMGDLFQCFIDIEENTRRTATGSKEISLNTMGLSTQSDFPKGESRPDAFTYMCPKCHSFQESEVIACTKCGAENPHHPSNKAKTETSKAEATSETAPTVTQCLRCGARLNQADKFCSSCGHAKG